MNLWTHEIIQMIITYFRRKKKLGFLKDESGGKIIEEFIGLKSKLYSIKYYNGETESKCKGLQKNVLKKFMT